VLDLTRARWSDLPQRRGILIEIKTELAADLPPIRGAENEIRDALTNLVFNAVDAMPEGGVAEVRTLVVASPNNPSQQCVQLEVRDTGLGMDAETRARCLEPFFTTKGVRGTGLGLAMVYGMAQRHTAVLGIDSAPGAGTTIRLAFPAAATLTPPSSEPGTVQTTARSLRILVVDDDPALITSLCDTLRDEGHEVTAADGGQAGIDAFGEALRTPKPFDVVITDLGMPQVDGRQVVDRVRSASPQTPIILLTGWGQHMAADNERAPPVDRLLSKPPRLRELRAALAELTA
jgi:CheY-like chemotaxis protein/anti-sigma regulatory factor (Ser/Thr protein kinase)